MSKPVVMIRHCFLVFQNITPESPKNNIGSCKRTAWLCSLGWIEGTSPCLQTDSHPWGPRDRSTLAPPGNIYWLEWVLWCCIYNCHWHASVPVLSHKSIEFKTCPCHGAVQQKGQRPNSWNNETNEKYHIYEHAWATHADLFVWLLLYCNHEFYRSVWLEDLILTITKWWTSAHVEDDQMVLDWIRIYWGYASVKHDNIEDIGFLCLFHMQLAECINTIEYVQPHKEHWHKHWPWHIHEHIVDCCWRLIIMNVCVSYTWKTCSQGRALYGHVPWR